MSNYNNKFKNETIESKKPSKEEFKKINYSNKYQKLILIISKIAIYTAIPIIIHFLLYKKQYENKLLEKNREIENIKRQLNYVTKEKNELQIINEQLTLLNQNFRNLDNRGINNVYFLKIKLINII